MADIVWCNGPVLPHTVELRGQWYYGICKCGRNDTRVLEANGENAQAHIAHKPIPQEMLHPACGRVFANGFQILAVDDSEPRSAKIMAIRNGEYVIARISDPVNDAEWSNGFYTRNVETAHWNFRAR